MSIIKAKKIIVQVYKKPPGYLGKLTNKSNKKLRGMETNSTEVKN